jgi:hypothetical protein
LDITRSPAFRLKLDGLNFCGVLRVLMVIDFGDLDHRDEAKTARCLDKEKEAIAIDFKNHVPSILSMGGDLLAIKVIAKYPRIIGDRMAIEPGIMGPTIGPRAG